MKFLTQLIENFLTVFLIFVLIAIIFSLELPEDIRELVGIFELT
jgi:hypothetical protein